MFGGLRNLLRSKTDTTSDTIKSSDTVDTVDTVDTADTADTADAFDTPNTSDESSIVPADEIRVVTVDDVDVRSVCITCEKDLQPFTTADETDVYRLEDAKESTDRSSTLLSPENECVDCEIKSHPERFHGCAFCRRPLRDLFACTPCRIGFAEWIKESINSDTIALSIIKRQANNIVLGMVESGYIENREFIYRPDEMNYFKWPGFFAGMSNCTENGERKAYLPTWVKPIGLTVSADTASIDITGSEDLKSLKDRKLFENALLRILESNNIYIYNNTQIDLLKTGRAQVFQIESYDPK